MSVSFWVDLLADSCNHQSVLLTLQPSRRIERPGPFRRRIYGLHLQNGRAKMIEICGTNRDLWRLPLAGALNER
jgi:hypothetical protein